MHILSEFEDIPYHERAKTMTVSRSGGLYILVHGASAPSEDEWNHYIEWAKRDIRRSHLSTLVHFGDESQGPNPRQRRRIKEIIDLHAAASTAVLTDSVAGRGVVTALNWFTNDVMRAYRASEGLASLEYLKIYPHDRQRVVDKMATMVESMRRAPR